MNFARPSKIGSSSSSSNNHNRSAAGAAALPAVVPPGIPVYDVSYLDQIDDRNVLLALQKLRRIAPGTSNAPPSSSTSKSSISSSRQQRREKLKRKKEQQKQRKEQKKYQQQQQRRRSSKSSSVTNLTIDAASSSSSLIARQGSRTTTTREAVILSQTSSTNYGPDSATSEVIVSRNNSMNGNDDGSNLSSTASPEKEDGTAKAPATTMSALATAAAAATAPTTLKMMKVRTVSAIVSNTAASAALMSVTTTPTPTRDGVEVSIEEEESSSGGGMEIQEQGESSSSSAAAAASSVLQLPESSAITSTEEGVEVASVVSVSPSSFISRSNTEELAAAQDRSEKKSRGASSSLSLAPSIATASSKTSKSIASTLSLVRSSSLSLLSRSRSSHKSKRSFASSTAKKQPSGPPLLPPSYGVMLSTRSTTYSIPPASSRPQELSCRSATMCSPTFVPVPPVLEPAPPNSTTTSTSEEEISGTNPSLPSVAAVPSKIASMKNDQDAGDPTTLIPLNDRPLRMNDHDAGDPTTLIPLNDRPLSDRSTIPLMIVPNLTAISADSTVASCSRSVLSVVADTRHHHNHNHNSKNGAAREDTMMLDNSMSSTTVPRSRPRPVAAALGIEPQVVEATAGTRPTPPPPVVVTTRRPHDHEDMSSWGGKTEESLFRRKAREFLRCNPAECGGRSSSVSDGRDGPSIVPVSLCGSQDEGTTTYSLPPVPPVDWERVRKFMTTLNCMGDEGFSRRAAGGRRRHQGGSRLPFGLIVEAGEDLLEDSSMYDHMDVEVLKSLLETEKRKQQSENIKGRKILGQTFNDMFDLTDTFDETFDGSFLRQHTHTQPHHYKDTYFDNGGPTTVANDTFLSDTDQTETDTDDDEDWTGTYASSSRMSSLLDDGDASVVPLERKMVLGTPTPNSSNPSRYPYTSPVTNTNTNKNHQDLSGFIRRRSISHKKDSWTSTPHLQPQQDHPLQEISLRSVSRISALPEPIIADVPTSLIVSIRSTKKKNSHPHDEVDTADDDSDDCDAETCSVLTTPDMTILSPMSTTRSSSLTRRMLSMAAGNGRVGTKKLSPFSKNIWRNKVVQPHMQ